MLLTNGGENFFPIFICKKALKHNVSGLCD